MGYDTPLGVLSDRYRGMHHFFRQNFSQVTNPPIDSLRERRVMTLKTRLGNLGNILDEDEAQLRLLQLESPVLSNAERSEEHTSELQSLMRISYAVFCLKKKKTRYINHNCTSSI